MEFTKHGIITDSDTSVKGKYQLYVKNFYNTIPEIGIVRETVVKFSKRDSNFYVLLFDMKTNELKNIYSSFFSGWIYNGLLNENFRLKLSKYYFDLLEPEDMCRHLLTTKNCELLELKGITKKDISKIESELYIPNFKTSWADFFMSDRFCNAIINFSREIVS